jgi:hypothetical protein
MHDVARAFNEVHFTVRTVAIIIELARAAK